METTKIEAVVTVIDQALEMAARKGVFGLQDATVVNQALTFLKEHLKIEEAAVASEPVEESSN